jgi:hypothetical protein
MTQQLFLQRALSADTLTEQTDLLIRTYGRPLVSALLFGIAGAAPRSSAPNLADLLAKLISARSELCRMWMTEVLFSVCVMELVIFPSSVHLSRILRRVLITVKQTSMLGNDSSRR